MKITVVGAGAVGASCAEYIAIKNFASEVGELTTFNVDKLDYVSADTAENRKI